MLGPAPTVSVTVFDSVVVGYRRGGLSGVWRGPAALLLGSEAGGRGAGDLIQFSRNMPIFLRRDLCVLTRTPCLACSRPNDLAIGSVVLCKIGGTWGIKKSYAEPTSGLAWSVGSIQLPYAMKAPATTRSTASFFGVGLVEAGPEELRTECEMCPP